ncbi:hypothetical protein [Wenxinia marina]|uniref:Uncharacterized protein n=1 Tax=Wenxinia marina DSM 24838 TaxID=1123501 RepID=A0A0D0Q7T6_9RHOB|nr:hypothetical protein [Wenxinia marina]KIQ70519.1 hypothetical protein Wenmar_00895 [Wenxinia marina DSM 24838]GGL52503.1 hypothetical protein GCM10011392_03560 [Wenxinia marina]
MDTGHGWIFGVLSDLKSYADKNGMTGLSDGLARATLAAQEDLAQHGRRPEGAMTRAAGNVDRIRDFSRNRRVS